MIISQKLNFDNFITNCSYLQRFLHSFHSK
nr:MAG TPA_asm: hypothetical protein [Caudoviricetes sp.]